MSPSLFHRCQPSTPALSAVLSPPAFPSSEPCCLSLRGLLLRDECPDIPNRVILSVPSWVTLGKLPSLSELKLNQPVSALPQPERQQGHQESRLKALAAASQTLAMTVDKLRLPPEPWSPL